MFYECASIINGLIRQFNCNVITETWIKSKDFKVRGLLF